MDFGIIVDSAVVLVEAFMVRLAMAQTEAAEHPSHGTAGWRWNALRSTAVQVGKPVLFAKAIIICAFCRFLRLSGWRARFSRRWPSR